MFKHQAIRKRFALKRHILCGFLAAIALPIVAHTPYLAPSSFEPVMGNMVTLDASFAERFFIPEAAFDNSTFEITNPAGETGELDTVVSLKTRVVLEHKLEAEGTYRITTGERHGAVFMIYELDGERQRKMNPTEPLPTGAKLLQHFQSITRADTYISRKNISSGALKVSKSGLEILPLDNPNNLFADESFQLKILLNDEVLINQDLLVYPALAESDDESQTFTTDNKGIAHINLDAGQYLIRARHRGPVPKGESAKAPNFSYTTTLSFQVFENI